MTASSAVLRMIIETLIATPFLCNPTIKEVRSLPKLMFCDHFVSEGAGLSHDCRSDDYKFVVFGYDLKSYDSKAEIYSLHNDCWREISFDWGGMIDYEIRSFWLVNSQIFAEEFFVGLWISGTL